VFKAIAPRTLSLDKTHIQKGSATEVGADWQDTYFTGLLFNEYQAPLNYLPPFRLLSQLPQPKAEEEKEKENPEEEPLPSHLHQDHLHPDQLHPPVQQLLPQVSQIHLPRPDLRI
jgi:hypothetical protein